MTREEFELILEKAVARLNEDVRASTRFHGPDAFQQRVFEQSRLKRQRDKKKLKADKPKHQ